MQRDIVRPEKDARDGTSLFSCWTCRRRREGQRLGPGLALGPGYGYGPGVVGLGIWDVCTNRRLATNDQTWSRQTVVLSSLSRFHRLGSGSFACLGDAMCLFSFSGQEKDRKACKVDIIVCEGDGLHRASCILTAISPSSARACSKRHAVDDFWCYSSLAS